MRKSSFQNCPVLSVGSIKAFPLKRGKAFVIYIDCGGYTVFR